jgi:hypothetical protein
MRPTVIGAPVAACEPPEDDPAEDDPGDDPAADVVPEDEPTVEELLEFFELDPHAATETASNKAALMPKYRERLFTDVPPGAPHA